MSNIEYCSYDGIYCPYEIMGLERTTNISKAEFKQLYKYLAKQLHPDKGGTNHKFTILQWAYKTVYRELRRKWNYNERIVSTKYNPGEMNSTTINTEEFKIEVFNKEFEHFKVANEFDIIPEKVTVIEAPSVVKEENFNQEFEQHHNNYLRSADLVIKEEPVDVNNLYEAEQTILGRQKIKDFTTSKSTDYAKAYTVYNTIYHNVNVKPDSNTKTDLSEKLNNRIFGSKITSNDVNKLNQIRSKQSFELTEKEKHILKLKEIKKTEEEKKRRLYLRQQDLLIQENYNKFNKLITKK